LFSTKPSLPSCPIPNEASSFFRRKKEEASYKKARSLLPSPNLIIWLGSGKGGSFFQKNSVFLEEGEEGSYAFGGLTSFTTIFISINFHFIIIERL
jgi:hypothetical protein